MFTYFQYFCFFSGGIYFDLSLYLKTISSFSILQTTLSSFLLSSIVFGFFFVSTVIDFWTVTIRLLLAGPGARAGLGGRRARLARGVVDTEVEEEPAAGGDGEARRQREALELRTQRSRRRDRVWGAGVLSGGGGAPCGRHLCRAPGRVAPSTARRRWCRPRGSGTRSGQG